ncbi:hypothetical protein [Paracoccus beibuensis]|uniref:hypothetical protein n=1 Tax=Paracoccus beibuensis TaxID=547602 RepID=UPI00223F996F|nr:hypothetical protein [Paracoccus beibuensis]
MSFIGDRIARLLPNAYETVHFNATKSAASSRKINELSVVQDGQGGEYPRRHRHRS